MKIKLGLLVVLYGFFVSSGFVMGQSKSQLNAVKRIVENNKQSFLGKPFSILYNALPIKPVLIWGGPDFKDMKLESSQQFYFVSYDSLDATNALCIDIVWTVPVTLKEANKYQRGLFRILNSKELPTYYNRIMKEISVYWTPFDDF